MYEIVYRLNGCCFKCYCSKPSFNHNNNKKNNSKTKIIQIPKEKIPKPNKINTLHLFIISITRELQKHFTNACIVRTLQVEMFSFWEAIDSNFSSRKNSSETFYQLCSQFVITNYQKKQTTKHKTNWKWSTEYMIVSIIKIY